VTIVCGTFLLHTTKDVDLPMEAFMQLLVRGSSGGGGVNGMAGPGPGGSSRLSATDVDDGLELGAATTPNSKTAIRRGVGQR
jgi:hypothetical protein